MSDSDTTLPPPHRPGITWRSKGVVCNACAGRKWIDCDKSGPERCTNCKCYGGLCSCTWEDKSWMEILLQHAIESLQRRGNPRLLDPKERVIKLPSGKALEDLVTRNPPPPLPAAIQRDAFRAFGVRKPTEVELLDLKLKPEDLIPQPSSSASGSFHVRPASGSSMAAGPTPLHGQTSVVIQASVTRPGQQPVVYTQHYFYGPGTQIPNMLTPEQFFAQQSVHMGGAPLLEPPPGDKARLPPSGPRNQQPRGHDGIHQAPPGCVSRQYVQPPSQYGGLNQVRGTAHGQRVAPVVPTHPAHKMMLPSSGQRQVQQPRGQGNVNQGPPGRQQRPYAQPPDQYGRLSPVHGDLSSGQQVDSTPPGPVVASESRPQPTLTAVDSDHAAAPGAMPRADGTQTTRGLKRKLEVKDELDMDTANIRSIPEQGQSRNSIVHSNDKQEKNETNEVRTAALGSPPNNAGSGRVVETEQELDIPRTSLEANGQSEYLFPLDPRPNKRRRDGSNA